MDAQQQQAGSLFAQVMRAWADLQGPSTMMFVFQVPESYSLIRLPVECLWRSRVMNMGSIRAGTAKLACKKS